MGGDPRRLHAKEIAGGLSPDCRTVDSRLGSQAVLSVKPIDTFSTGLPPLVSARNTIAFGSSLPACAAWVVP
jgi:hypothetical protein